MDNNTVILDDSAKASGNMDLYPNKDENKSSSELSINARPTKGTLNVNISKKINILYDKFNSNQNMF